MESTYEVKWCGSGLAAPTAHSDPLPSSCPSSWRPLCIELRRPSLELPVPPAASPVTHSRRPAPALPAPLCPVAAASRPPRSMDGLSHCCLGVPTTTTPHTEAGAAHLVCGEMGWWWWWLGYDSCYYLKALV